MRRLNLVRSNFWKSVGSSDGIFTRSKDLCCLQEVRWHFIITHRIKGIVFGYDVLLFGKGNGSVGVGFLLSKEWIEKVNDI